MKGMKDEVVYRHSLAARITHWFWFIAILVLVMSGLQIFNASPQLDASDKSDPARRVLSIDAHRDPVSGFGIGTTTIAGHTFTTTDWLGYTDDGSGGRAARAFPGWLTLPGPQDLAGGRHWHFFFGWVLTLSLVVYIVAGAIRKDLRELIVRPSDFPKLLPMQLYYLRLRKHPPPHGKYNPLQKLTYTVVLFIFIPLLIVTGLALSPGIDSIAQPLTQLLGGRQFARLWHFGLMCIIIAYFFVHMALVVINGPFNEIRSMITGWYRLREDDGVGI
jgi:thiosulfate reductase cytochrome b subunit